jgi:tRNA dimethylallyltransferase
MKGKINIICGPTASGKSAHALALAKSLDGVIINGDSMQIYKHIPILTAQPTVEELAAFPHELYGFIEPGVGFSVAQWLEIVIATIKEAFDKVKTPIIVGGTGLYLKSLIDGFADIPNINEPTQKYIAELDSKSSNEELYAQLKQIDPTLQQRIKPNDRKRILRALAVYFETNKPLSWWQANNHVRFFNRSEFYITLINPERSKLYNNINQRFINMMNEGAVEEVEYITKNYPGINYPEAIGFREINAYLLGNIGLDHAISQAQQHSRNYAKRQITWFKNQLSYDDSRT